jgi:hypothetical protein
MKRYVILPVQLWLAHAMVFFAHEYGHSFTAWALGFKAHPLVLNFGTLSLRNLLIMSEIDEKVDYAPIFAAGHGAAAALIAAAGVLSNFFLYIALWIAFRRADRNRPSLMLLLFWLCVMCAGNLLDYVPIRTFSPVDDMSTVVKGLGITPWMAVLGLGIPFLAELLHLFLRLLPQAGRTLFPNDKARQSRMVVLTAFIVFVFYALAGFEHGEGPAAPVLALLSIFVIFPLVSFACWPRGFAQSGLPS